MGYGNFVTRIRKHLHLSQREFSERLKVAASTVSDWEREEMVPTVESLESMLGLIDPDLTLAECLVLPFEVQESDRKYRAILSIIGGLSPAPVIRREAKVKPISKPQSTKKVERPASSGRH